MSTQSFQVAIPQSDLDDFHERLDRTRWIDDLNDPGWAQGLSVIYMRELVHYWQTVFN